MGVVFRTYSFLFIRLFSYNVYKSLPPVYLVVHESCHSTRLGTPLLRVCVFG